MLNDHFKDLNLSTPILKALNEEGYTTPTPVQAAAIPIALAGRDLMATAQTGTGKTAAFALPLLQRLSESAPPKERGAVRALILTPTRELAVQIDQALRAYGRHLKLRTTVVLGGVGINPQIRALSRGPDIVVATPGRLIDHIEQRNVRLDRVEAFVLDEADRMLDMGFIRDVRKIERLIPRKRQTLFFSATMSREIEELAGELLRNPERIQVTPPATVVGKIDQKVLFVNQRDKLALLTDLLRDPAMGRTLVFTRTKHRADRVTKSLVRDGVLAEVIHSNKTQGARQRALDEFGRGRVRVLVATDIVARGIDVDGISHVINYELPHDAESYVHRIGRTARAGADGIAFSFCDVEEVRMLRAIERLTRTPLTVHADHPYSRPAPHSVTTPSRRPAPGLRGAGPRRKRTAPGRRTYR
jgi:ATP-dependent RNA helicase RhlE